MKHYVLFYDYAPDYMERRAPLRDLHLAHARASNARDELQLGGAFTDAPFGGLLVFKAEAPAVAEAFAKADPYVLNAVVTGWRVREWTTVVGAEALTKI